jgi:hypothetical protein
MPGGVAVELEIAMPQSRYVAIARKWFDASDPNIRERVVRLFTGPKSHDFYSGTGFQPQPTKAACVVANGISTEELCMRKALAILATVATIGATAASAPAQARGWGWGPGIGLGLAAGALTAGAVYGAYGPYGYYGPGYYGYYRPRYYGPAYYGYYGRPYYRPGYGPYAYYGGPYYRPYWRHW